MKHPVRFVVFCTVISGALLWSATRYFKPKPPAPPFRFPSAQLAAIDRDLQVRFAVVPEKRFGIERTYGNQHYLYDPQTPAELHSVAALKKRDTEVAFYLMSRALWLRSWDGWGYKPIQGPVVLTGKIISLLPRAINFSPRDSSARNPIIDQDDSYDTVRKWRGPDDAPHENGIITHNPDGKTVPSPTPPKNTPRFNQLQAIGNRVFDLAENAPKTQKIGIYEPVNADWKVVAVPIRASSAKCLPCHVYQPMGTNPQATKRLTVDVGDALGVAFYLYKERVPSSSPTGATANR